MSTDLIPFWQALLRAPRQVGAIVPAGRFLGQAIVREVLDGNPGLVIELGAGTGSITQALFAVRHQLSDLIVFEKAPELAARLHQKFPGLTVHGTCASKISQLDLLNRNTLTLVSSLPFRSLPAGDRHQLSDAIVGISSTIAQFRLIQYSYFGRLPFTSPTKNLSWRKKQTVVRNLPPATVWVLEKS